ncbi:MAG: carbohydrate kinase family protein, partial [Candidatus Levybacteria bacterium]|nr:carbohydrate kinase family protein [Candidatus Levybacteria bacterium]
NDEFAQKIINTLSNEKVNTANVIQTNGQQSSFSTIINHKGERTIFSEHVKRSHNFNFDNVSTKWVYLTSIGEDWKNAYQKTVDFVKRTNSLLAFNPGTLQINGDMKDIKNVLFQTNVLFVNKEEAQALLKNSDQNMQTILKKLQKHGPKIIAITDGKDGSYSIDEKGNIIKGKIFEAKVVEKTGAGDSYSCGFLGAIIQGKSIQESMTWGSLNSASVIEKVGSQAGLLYKADFDRYK